MSINILTSCCLFASSRAILCIFLVAIAPLTLSSCLVGPKYTPPKVTIPAHYKEQAHANRSWVPINPQDTKDRGQWWKVFHNPTLDGLEHELNEHNQNIAIAYANYQQSLALIDVARAALYPSLAGSIGLIRQNQSTTPTANFVGIASGARASTRTLVSSVLAASWEPDLWGSVRRTIEANEEAAKANEALLASTKLALQSSLAQYYFELCIVDDNQIVLNHIVNTNKKLLTLTKNQYKAGVVSEANVTAAEIVLAEVKQAAVNNTIFRGQYEHAIAVLTGRPPALVAIEHHHPKKVLPVIPVSIPSVLLERRPDVAAAEHMVHNANALIGVAVAAYFPNLLLDASTAAFGSSFHQLVHKPSIAWSSQALLSETIIDGGLRNATLKQFVAQYQAEVAAYRQTVLNAFMDVEDNLVMLKSLKVQANDARIVVLKNRKAYQIASNQYQAGIVAQSAVLDAKLNEYAAEKSFNDLQGLQLVTSVGLIKSLGGGWSNTETQPSLKKQPA